MKKKTKMNLKVLLCLLLTLLCYDNYAQLAPFTLTVTPTPQTCLGNGGLTFTTSGTAAGAQVDYAVYLLPNSTTPVVTVTNPEANGLVAGSYQVIATQTLSGQSGTALATAVIADNRIPFAYTLDIDNVNCIHPGSITVNVTSGTATQYEITAGPQTFPPQSSNVFSNLQAGQYQVRVFDACGDASVTTVTLQQYQSNITISNPQVYLGENPTCNDVTISYQFHEDYNTTNEIAFPVTIVYKIYPPSGGNPIVITDVITEGENTIYVNKLIPFFSGYFYYFDITITDNCGTIFTKPNNMVSLEINASLQSYTQSCNEFYMDFIVNNAILPVTLTFTQSPTGFNPSQYNESYPVMNESYTIFGSYTNPLPLGSYTIAATDACGKTITKSVILEESGSPYVQVFNGDGCFSGVSITMPNYRNITGAVLISAPQNYPGILPQDVMAFVSGSSLNMGSLKPGDYVFNITDECGRLFTIPVTIFPNVDTNVYVQQNQGCIVGLGSLMLYVSGTLQSVKIVSAPAAFNQPLPLDVSSNIYNNGFFMNSLPEGSYTFETVDLCNNPRTVTLMLEGYRPNENPVDIVYNCGSFDIDLHAAPFGDTGYYYLEKYDEISNSWVNPVTGNNQYGYFLTDNTIHYNFTYTGRFRIVRVGNYYISGSEGGSAIQNCRIEIFSFTFTGKSVINGAYVFPCSGNLAEVIIDAVGSPPLTYSITLKNNEPFIVNNGENFVFTGLEIGKYNFSVTDNCGNITNIQYDLNNLGPMDIVQEGFCSGQYSLLSVKQYSFLTYEWWKEGAPNTILSTQSKLEFPSFGTTDEGTYFLKIISTSPGSCIDIILLYTIDLPQQLTAGEDKSVTLCGGNGSIDLKEYLSAGHGTDGVWIDLDGAGLIGSVLNTELLQGGIYTFKYVVTTCGLNDEAIITIDFKGSTVNLSLIYGCDGIDYRIAVDNMSDFPGAALAWTGPGGFLSSSSVNVITGGLPGIYIVNLITTDGCSYERSIEVEDTTICLDIPDIAMNIPKGISPNGDGKNDSFDLTNLNVVKLEIFNRYGFMLYKAANYKNDWNGQTDNGKEAPTGVYYYAVVLDTGEQRTGWVYLQREE